MKKKAVLAIICLIFVVLLLIGCGPEELNREEFGVESIISKNMMISGISENTVIADVNEDIGELLVRKEKLYIEEVYNTFDWESIEKELRYATPIDTEIIDLNRNVNTESPNIEYEGSFPKGLVESIAKLLYQNNLTGERMSEKNDYFDFLAQYGGEDNKLTVEELEELFPEIKEHHEEIEDVYDAYLFCDALGEQWVREYCYDIFHFFSKDNTEYYVYVYGNPGTGGYCSAEVTKRKSGETEWTEDHIMMQAQGFAELIYYEGEYYFVFIQSNKRLKYQDGIRIYRIESDDVQADNVFIRCIPEEFVWREDYVSSESPGEELSFYIEQIKDKITDTEYIERGDTYGGTTAIKGDGEVATENLFKGRCPYDNQPIQKLDFANMGIPIYFWTHIYQGEKLSPYIQAQFYIYDDKSPCRVFELGEGEWTDITDTVQIWFHEIDGKVYTFLVYHLAGYNYMLTVKLIEGNEVTPIAQYHIIPRFSYEITEGQLYGD